MADFLISIAGAAAQSAEALGWSLESLQRRSQAADVALLKMTRHRPSDAARIARNDKVVIWHQGTRIFTGKAQPASVQNTESGSAITVPVFGPWFDLEQQTFCRGVYRGEGGGGSATASVSGGAVTSVAVTGGGSGYYGARVIFTGGGGVGAIARATVSNGQVISVSIISGGTGYTTVPTVELLGVTQLPPRIGDTYTVPSGSGISIWNPATEEFETPSPSTTYKWARADNAGATPIEVDIARYCGTRGLLCDPNWGEPPIYRTVFEEIKELLNYSQFVPDRLGLEQPLTCDFAQMETDLGANATPKYRTWQDAKVSSLISQLLAVKPDVATWFDYSSSVPALRMRSAAVETEQTLRLGQAPLMSISATPRPELAPAGMVIRWEFSEDNNKPWFWRGYRVPAHVDKSPADVLPHEAGVVTQTLEYVPELGVEGLGSYRPTLAAALMQSLGPVRASGSMVLRPATAGEALGIRPGLTYRLTDPMLSACQLLVQETTWTPASNQVQCSLGYPRSLDLQTISDLRGWLVRVFSGSYGNYAAILPPAP
jgi:hypothetical protein